jgi:hypothetical protein
VREAHLVATWRDQRDKAVHMQLTCIQALTHTCTHMQFKHECDMEAALEWWQVS